MNDLLRVDHVTLLADLRVPRNKKGKRKLECNSALDIRLARVFPNNPLSLKESI